MIELLVLIISCSEESCPFKSRLSTEARLKIRSTSFKFCGSKQLNQKQDLLLNCLYAVTELRKRITSECKLVTASFTSTNFESWVAYRASESCSLRWINRSSFVASIMSSVA